MVVRMLRSALRACYLARLLGKPDQGKAYSCTNLREASNHFLLNGRYTRFCDYRFIHRARLGVVPLNGARRFGNGDKRCRRCGYVNETLPHVLNHCTVHSAAWQRRHNAVQDRLARGARLPPGAVLNINRQVPGVRSTLRPDLVVLNEASREVKIIDICIPFEGAPDALEVARQQKLEKYNQLAAELSSNGYRVSLDAFVVGSLGAWLAQNFRVAKSLGIAPKYTQTMARLMTSDTIRWSRDIYIEHLTGQRQYHEQQL